MLYWDNTPYGSVGGYLTYIGTSEQLGGLEWLAGGPAGELVCFPGYYTKYEALRSWIMSQWEDIPGRVLVDQHYDWY